MSKFNVESAFVELSKKLSTLTAKIIAQSALIETQSKKIDDQQQAINNNSTIISEQMRVIHDLTAKVDKYMESATSKCEKDVPAHTPAVQRASETTIGTETTATSSQNKLTDRARRATERSKSKGATMLHKRERFDTANPTDEVIKVDSPKNIDLVDWKVVSNRKKTKKIQPSNTIQRGGNLQISAFQAIEKKKFLHVWSLHPVTSEETITEHVIKICNSKDVKVEKIIPKSKRDYSSFLIGVPESKFEIINSVENWPLNTQFNEWRWFRNPQKSSKGSEDCE